jgi:hypothetical protein
VKFGMGRFHYFSSLREVLEELGFWGGEKLGVGV